MATEGGSGLPDVTDNPYEWVVYPSRDPKLWVNLIHENVYSEDHGKTFWISTDRVHPDIPRERYTSRKVKKK